MHLSLAWDKPLKGKILIRKPIGIRQKASPAGCVHRLFFQILRTDQTGFLQANFRCALKHLIKKIRARKNSGAPDVLHQEKGQFHQLLLHFHNVLSSVSHTFVDHHKVPEKILIKRCNVDSRPGPTSTVLLNVFVYTINQDRAQFHEEFGITLDDSTTNLTNNVSYQMDGVVKNKTNHLVTKAFENIIGHCLDENEQKFWKTVTEILFNAIAFGWIRDVF